MTDEFDKLIDDAGAKIANAVVTFALLRASRGRGRPDIIALKLIEAVVSKGVKDVGHGADKNKRSYVRSLLKGASYKALFLEFDRIIETDGWESLPIPFDQWAVEACMVAKASAERAVMEIEENNSPRTVKRLIKSASDDVQKGRRRQSCRMAAAT